MQGNFFAEATKNPMAMSPNYVGHLEKVYSNVRQTIGRQPEDALLEIDVNMMIW